MRRNFQLAVLAAGTAPPHTRRPDRADDDSRAVRRVRAGAYVPFVPGLDKPVYCSACFDLARAARAATG